MLSQLNVPNRLSLLRICLVPFIVIFMLPIGTDNFWVHFVKGPLAGLLVLLLFMAASFTDFLDGHIARKQNLVTNFGKFVDPIADKLLVISVMLCLIQRNRLNALPVIIIVAREFIVTGLRLIGAEQNKVIAAANLGKLKTVLQILALISLLLEPIFEGFSGEPWPTLHTISDVLFVLSLIMAIVSAIDYLRKNRELIKQ